MSISPRRPGPTCIVTGANRGIGREIARGLADQGARVVLACRDIDKAVATRAELQADTQNEAIEAAAVDMSSPESIRQFVERFTKGHDRLHVLVNSAATHVSKRQLSDDGFELTWATNVLGPYLMTELFLDLLSQTGHHRWRARVVNICSNFDGGLGSADTQYASRRYDATKAYKASKQALRMLTWDLDDRLPGTGVVANACFPGRVDTPLGRLRDGGLGGLLGRRRGVRPVAVGADTGIWLASSPEVEGLSGALFFERQERPCEYRNPGACAALGDYCAEQLGLE